MTDKEALKRVKSGEIDCFTHFVKKYTKRIELFVKMKLATKQDRDDIIQETFLKFYRSIDKFDEARPLPPYLYAIAKNELKMYWRKQKETISLNEELETASRQENWETSDAASLLIPLHPPERKAILMIAEGYSYREVADSLERPVNSIRTLIRRARLKLLKLQNI